ncbi:hypothetical protein RhiTH_003422 [Rhizoctonia solani]
MAPFAWLDKLFVDAQGTCKIGEFGLASLVEGFESFAPSISQGGRVRWLSPELLQTEPDQRMVPTIESDVWALGCTLFEIMSGKLPYFPYQHDLRVRHEITSKTLAGHRDNLLSPDFVEIWGLVTSCWEWAADQRPSVTELAQSISKTMIGLGSPDLSTMDVHNSEQIKVIINIPSRSSQTDQGSGHNSAVTFESHYRYTPYEKITGKTAADILKEVDQTPQSSNTVLECHRDYLPLYGGPKTRERSGVLRFWEPPR